jgi:hypothetical protein
VFIRRNRMRFKDLCRKLHGMALKKCGDQQKGRSPNLSG